MEVNADKLVVDLVLDIAEQDEGRDDTLAARRLHAGLDVAVPHVGGGGQDGADRLGGHGEQDAAVVDEGLALADPVRLAGVAEVLANVLVAVERVHLVRLVLAHRGGHARVEREGHARVAAAEAVGTDTALAVFCRFPGSVGILTSNSSNSNSREQQGASLGHFCDREHDGGSAARTVVAPRRAAPRGRRARTMAMISACRRESRRDEEWACLGSSRRRLARGAKRASRS